MSPDKLNRVVSASTVTIILSQIISTQVVLGSNDSNPLKKDKSKDPLFWSYKHACSMYSGARHSTVAHIAPVCNIYLYVLRRVWWIYVCVCVCVLKLWGGREGEKRERERERMNKPSMYNNIIISYLKSDKPKHT